MTLPSLARADRILLSIVLIVGSWRHCVSGSSCRRRQARSASLPPSSTYRAAQKAGYEVLQRLDLPATRLRRRISSETLKGIGLLFVLRPEVGLREKKSPRYGNGSIMATPWSSCRASRPRSAARPHWPAMTCTSTIGSSGIRPRPTLRGLASYRWPSASQPSKPEADSRLAEGLNQLTTPRDRRFAAKRPFLGYGEERPGGKVFWKDGWARSELKPARATARSSP